MTQEQRNRLAKVYELVKRGATEGERAAASNALDKLMDKFNVTIEQLNSIDKNRYSFKYSNKMEMWLMIRLVHVLLHDETIIDEARKVTGSVREIKMYLKYLDWVTIESAYEYFRRHMKAEWNRTCAPIVDRCRKAKTKAKKREELQPVFFNRYVFASKLYDQKDLKNVVAMSEKESGLAVAIGKLEGGQYNKQVTNGLLIGSGKA